MFIDLRLEIISRTATFRTFWSQCFLHFVSIMIFYNKIVSTSDFFLGDGSYATKIWQKLHWNLEIKITLSTTILVPIFLTGIFILLPKHVFYCWIIVYCRFRQNNVQLFGFKSTRRSWFPSIVGWEAEEKEGEKIQNSLQISVNIQRKIAKQVRDNTNFGQIKSRNNNLPWYLGIENGKRRRRDDIAAPAKNPRNPETNRAEFPWPKSNPNLMLLKRNQIRVPTISLRTDLRKSPSQASMIFPPWPINRKRL